MHLIQDLEKSMDETNPDWKVFLTTGTATTIEYLIETCKLTQTLVDNAIPSVSERANMDAIAAEGKPTTLMDMYRDLLKEQARLLGSYLQEISNVSLEDEQALKKKADNAPILYKAMQALAEAGVLRDIVDDVRKQDVRGKK